MSASTADPVINSVRTVTALTSRLSFARLRWTEESDIRRRRRLVAFEDRDAVLALLNPPSLSERWNVSLEALLLNLDIVQ